MRWIITRDFTASQGDEDYAVGINGNMGNWRARICPDTPSGVAEIDALSNALTHEFRLLDGDGEVCYLGMCENPADFYETAAFGALDWAEAYTGCTAFEFRPADMGNTNAPWEML